ncbi:hypothetical protein [Hymenobacter sp. B81]|uniref:hypothetical protein n=1 Tax=Hymenobacter sp. B81 TaxID=3344878 RepID=UPI0037DC02A9
MTALSLSQPHPEARLVPINLDVLDAGLLAQTLAQDPDIRRKAVHVLVDCQQLRSVRDYGVCHFLNQLLLIRQAGVRIVLHNVSPLLRRLLRVLRLESLFEVTWPSQASLRSQPLPPAA